MNLNDKKSKWTHRNTAVYFDSFGIECIPKRYLTKSEINQLLTIYLEYFECEIMILLCVDFVVSLS